MPSSSSTRTRTRRATHPMRTLACAAALALTLGATAAQGALFEPAGNQVLFGMWFDPADPFYDTPTIINEKLGVNVPVYQIAQSIPLPAYNYTTGAGGAAPENMIERSGTDAAVFLTVYPTSGFDAVTTADFDALAKQILDYQTTNNRTVFLRYAPEMQGTWMVYGQQPTAFNTSWHTMYSTIKATAPDTIMVWAPNTPQGYPYGQTAAFAALDAVDQALLDTNNNGALDADDDSLAPYYPGDDVVDWIGLSIYYKGIPSDVQNTVQADGYCYYAMNGTSPSDTSTNITNWYADYCEAKPDKACMFAEAGAAYHMNDTGTATEAQLQQAWLNDCVTNTSLYADFPRLKMYMQFEYTKTESANDGSDDPRDYRLTNNTEVVAELSAGLASAGTLFSWANIRAVPTSISSAGAPAATNSDGSTVQNAITATTRAKSTSFPSLFGTSAGSQTAQWCELGVLVTAGVAGAFAVMRNL